MHNIIDVQHYRCHEIPTPCTKMGCDGDMNIDSFESVSDGRIRNKKVVFVFRGYPASKALMTINRQTYYETSNRTAHSPVTTLDHDACEDDNDSQSCQAETWHY